MAESDLDYAKVTGRFALTVADSDDDGDNPDIVYCDEGTVEFTPLVTFTKVAAATPAPFEAGNSVIVAQISSANPESANYYAGGAGYLMHRGKPFVMLVDLTSTKVNPNLAEEGKATHSVSFKNLKADGTPVNFPARPVRVTKDGLDGDGVNDLVRLLPVTPGAATPITVGPRGLSVAAASVNDDGELVFTFTDGSEQSAGAIPGTAEAYDAANAAASSAATATARASEASAYSEAALESAADADTSADLADAARAEAETARGQAQTARTEAETARDDLLSQKGTASGLAPLGSDGKLPETHVPDRLSETSLNASFAAGVNLPPSNGTDDTATVQAVLDAAAAFSVTPRVFGVPGETYYTSGWVIGSGIQLDMTGCEIKRRPGGRMLLRNAAYKGSGARDHDILVIGGDWDHRSNLTGSASGDQNDLHTMIFHRVDGARVTDATFRDTPGAHDSKYSLYFVDATRYSAERIRFEDRPSDGIHVSGPARGGHLKTLSGVTGDDFVGVTGCDYTPYQATAGGGDIEALIIEDVDMEDAASGVLLNAGQDEDENLHTVRGVTIRDVRGTANKNVIRILDDSGHPGTTGGIWEDILIQCVSASPGAAGYGAPFFYMTPEGRAAGSVMRRITLRDIYQPSAIDQIVVDGAVIEDLTIDGLRGDAARTTACVDIKNATSNIGTLRIANARAALTTGGYLLKQQGTVSRLVLDDVVTTGTPSACLLYGDTDTVIANGVQAERFALEVNAATEAPTVRATNCVAPTAGYAFLYLSHASATATLYGANITGRAVDRSGTQTLRATGVGIQVDANKLTPSAGDKIHNYNGSSTKCPYVGAVTYDGSAWRADAGALATGTIALVAGTATVTPTAAVQAALTTSCVVRLELVTPGGTVGTHYISARVAATSFTITSTSNTDTSTVRWHLLRI